MIKFLIFAALGYLAYRVFFKPPRIEQKDKKDLEEGEYVDYEEVD